MTQEFNAQEILKIAVKIEENGKQFYTQMEQTSSQPGLKQLWGHLALEEDNHRQTFSKMLQAVGDDLVNDSSNKEYQAYFNAIAREYIFSSDLVADQLKRPPQSDLAALDLAIAAEKESILVYGAFREYVLTQRQAVIDAIIAEERRHLTALSEVKKEMLEKRS